MADKDEADDKAKDEEATKSSDSSNTHPSGETVDQASSDALSRTPQELEEEKRKGEDSSVQAELEAKKRAPLWRRIIARINVYLLAFILILILAAIILIVYYFNSAKPVIVPTIGSQTLTTEALKDLANNDVSVGDATQTLTIKGNAIIDGQTLMRGNLNVAGNFQTGGSITAPNLIVSGTANLGTTQINSLQVAQNTAIQGDTTMRNLNVGGTSSFSGPMTAGQITVSRLVMAGNAVLEIPNHLAFTGATPGRTITPSVLGSGGSSSLNGSDTSGAIGVHTGNGPTTGCFIRVNFNQKFTSTPRVIVTPIGQAAGNTNYYVNRDVNGFNVCFGSTPTANSDFGFDFFVAG